MFTPSANLCPFDSQNGAQIIAARRNDGSFVGQLINKILETNDSRPQFSDTGQIFEELLPILVDAFSRDKAVINNLAVSLVAMAFFAEKVLERGNSDKLLRDITDHVKMLTNVCEGVMIEHLTK